MATKCRCLFTCPNNVHNGTCDLQPEGYCFTGVQTIFNQEKGILENETIYGCLPPTEGSILQCKGYLVPHKIPQSIICCNDKDYCNVEKIPTYFNPKSFEEDDTDGLFSFISPTSITVSLIIALVLSACIAIVIWIGRRRAKRENSDIKCMEDDFFEKNSSLIFDRPLLFPISKHQSFDYPCTLNYNSPYSPMISNSSSDNSSSAPSMKYAFFNNNSSNSNYTINSYRNMSSVVSNTTSSMFSENTQQTTLSSQKLTLALPPLAEDSYTSGSGSGTPRLVQQTLAREITLFECIGKGRFGNVWRGSRKGEQVAVKIFYSRDDASWKREIEIYSTVIMRHENILGYFGADVTSNRGSTQLWLVTDYCRYGSLYDFLNQRAIKDQFQMLSLMKSIIFGISHLHTEVIGTLGKPAIAHRDIKSKNILMKSDFSCCIADFGLAVTKIQTNDQIDIAQNHRVGTKRYMSPEVLDESMKSYLFESYCSADIYSLALVFWEILNRLKLDEVANKYSVPYGGLVPPDPSFEDMRTVVCSQGIRPKFTRADSLNFPGQVAKLITECWSHNPSARLTSLRVKKSIMSMLKTASE